MNLPELYNKLQDNRGEYLTDAQDLAEITLPLLRPDGNTVGQRPYSDAGGLSITNLVSTVKSVLFPQNISWFRTVLPPSVMAQFEQDQRQAVEKILARHDQSVTLQMSIAQLDAFLDELLERVFVEGNVAVQVVDQNTIRLFPLRSIAVERNAGKVRKLVIEECLPVDEGGQTPKLYTYVDYDEGTVWQQGPDDKDAHKVKVSARTYFVVTTKVPLIDSYAEGFANRFYGTINCINEFEKDLLAASAAAATNIMQVNNESGLDVSIIEQILRNTDAVNVVEVANGGNNAITWATLGAKINDYSVLFESVAQKRKELQDAFGSPIYSRELGDRITATHILQLRQELDRRTASLASTLSTTLQLPLIQAFMEVLGTQEALTNAVAQALGIEAEDDAQGVVQVTLVTGASALAREALIEKLLSVIQTMGAVKPEFVQKIDDFKLFSVLAANMGLDTTDIFSELGQAQQVLMQIITNLDDQQAQALLQQLTQPQEKQQ